MRRWFAALSLTAAQKQTVVEFVETALQMPLRVLLHLPAGTFAQAGKPSYAHDSRMLGNDVRTRVLKEEGGLESWASLFWSLLRAGRLFCAAHCSVWRMAVVY